MIPVLRGGRADAGARREEAAARRARLGEARRPRMPAEPRRPAALPSEPAREARRRRPHSLDAGLVPDRGRDEAQRGEPRGGEGRGAHRNLRRGAAAAVRHGRPRRRRWRRRRRRRGSCGGGRRSVRVGARAREAGGEQDALQQAVLRHRWRVNAETRPRRLFVDFSSQGARARAHKGLRDARRSTGVSLRDCSPPAADWSSFYAAIASFGLGGDHLVSQSYQPCHGPRRRRLRYQPDACEATNNNINEGETAGPGTPSTRTRRRARPSGSEPP